MERFNQADFTLGLHAEIHACLGVPPEVLVGSEVYVARLLKSGETAIAAPCQVCSAFMESVGVRGVHYTLDQWSWFELSYR